MKTFAIKETVNATGYTDYIPKMVNTARGWKVEAKSWKTEAAAKAWISRRMKELAEHGNENKFSYEIVVHW